MSDQKILFLCVANSARSQMAEGLARQLLPEATIKSAGSMPSGKVHDCAIDVMKEIGLNLSAHRSESIEDLPKDFLCDLDYVVTLCQEEVCPTLPGTHTKKLHWPIPDPAAASGEELTLAFRNARDQIQSRLKKHFL